MAEGGPACGLLISNTPNHLPLVKVVGNVIAARFGNLRWVDQMHLASAQPFADDVLTKAVRMRGYMPRHNVMGWAVSRLTAP